MILIIVLLIRLSKLVMSVGTYHLLSCQIWDG